jgi:CubicO group peptidase (beta-lactamase class C family)
MYCRDGFCGMLAPARRAAGTSLRQPPRMDSAAVNLKESRMERPSLVLPPPARLLVWAASMCIALTACGGGGDSADDNPKPAARFYPDAATVPVSGPEVLGASRFDQIMTGQLKTNDVPGATLAIAKNGRLILARGYGYADFESKKLMQPDSMFRIGSISKVLTSMAILHLKDQGLLSLDEKALDILTDLQVPAGGDARLRDITVRNLLQHAGGWDRSITPDPDAREAARALGLPMPVGTGDYLRFALRQPLNFTPGTRFHYSNLGYCLLGPVVEKISGEPYEIYVRNHVLRAMDVNAMSIGKSRAGQQGPHEVKYYQYAGAPLFDSEFAGDGRVPAPYGAVLSRCPSSGSWIGSTVDLTRVMTTIDGSRKQAFLSADTMIEYTANPGLPPIVANEWWGLGIAVGPTPDAWSHGGLVDGSIALMQRNSQYTWAVLANSWPPDADAFAGAIHAAITQALGASFEGSATDLYSGFPSPTLPPSTE